MCRFLLFKLVAKEDFQQEVSNCIRNAGPISIDRSQNAITHLPILNYVCDYRAEISHCIITDFFRHLREVRTHKVLASWTFSFTTTPARSRSWAAPEPEDILKEREEEENNKEREVLEREILEKEVLNSGERRFGEESSGERSSR